MTQITDKQRIDALEQLLEAGDEAFKLEINFLEDEEDEDEEDVAKLQMFSFKTQWVEEDSVRKLLDILVKK